MLIKAVMRRTAFPTYTAAIMVGCGKVDGALRCHKDDHNWRLHRYTRACIYLRTRPLVMGIGSLLYL